MRPRLQHDLGGRATDPWYWGLWSRLPNPDAVLRKMGADQSVYDQILYDAHVMGEMRTIHAALLEFEWRIVPGGGEPAAANAANLATEIMARRPAPEMTWPDVAWSMADALFRGMAVHEVIWMRAANRQFVPDRIEHRSSRRFAFDGDGRLRLLTRRRPFDGEPVPEKVFLLGRHMPTYDNPYGIAVLSACFWPYVFKHSGYKYFTTFCERFGFPWPVGKYPPDGGSIDADGMVEAMSRMVMNGVAAIPSDAETEFPGHSVHSSGATPHERLTQACNRELSKALTSQTLATEIDGEGSRAASETHHARERAGHLSLRQIVSGTLNTLFEWVTEINFGARIAPPAIEYFDEDEARMNWAKLYETARRYVPIPLSDAYKNLRITPPTDGEPVLPGFGVPGPQRLGGPGNEDRREFAAPGAGPDAALDEALQAMLDADEGALVRSIGRELTQPIVDAARSDPDMLGGRLAELYPDIDAGELDDLLARVLFVAEILGRAEAAE